MGDLSPSIAFRKAEDALPRSAQTSDERASLTVRTIPTMSLSTAANPLTAPLPPTRTQSSSTTSHLRALSRFATPHTAVLTGGAGTLALASARALLEHGTFFVTLMDLPVTLASSAEHIKALKSDFSERTINTVPCDVTSATDVPAAFGMAASAMEGRIDMLLCFAGIVGCVHSIDTTVDQWRKVIDVNLTGSLLCAQAAARHMIAQNAKPLDHKPLHLPGQIQSQTPIGIPGYSILFTSSISAHATNYPQPQAAYNASKTALQSLTKSLAAEWCVHGIRVNSVSPGYLDTILNAGDSLQLVREVWAGRCPMGRMGDVEEIVGAIVMLMSTRAGRYITGTDIVVDGGAMCF